MVVLSFAASIVSADMIGTTFPDRRACSGLGCEIMELQGLHTEAVGHSTEHDMAAAGGAQQRAGVARAPDGSLEDRALAERRIADWWRARAGGRPVESIEFSANSSRRAVNAVTQEQLEHHPIFQRFEDHWAWPLASHLIDMTGTHTSIAYDCVCDILGYCHVPNRKALCEFAE